jgi:hypothetical protein
MVLGIMLNTYITFATHKTAQADDGITISIYPSKPLLWPTYLMLTTSAVSMLFNFCILISYFWGVRSANRVDTYASYWGYLVYAVNAAVWLASSTTFKMLEGDPSGSPSDLWGWSCSDLASEIQEKINGAVNFDLQCTTQVCPLYSLFHVLTTPFSFLSRHSKEILC